MNVSAIQENQQTKSAAANVSQRISVLIPTFNRTQYITRAILSVMEQTCPVEEIIVVDDGSDHSHRQVLEGLTSRFQKVYLHHLSENKGVSAARNHALDVSTGDYILFLDDDDWLHPQMIESTLALLEQDKSLAGVFCFHDYEDDAPSSRKPPNLGLLLNYSDLKRVLNPFTPVVRLKNDRLVRNPVFTILRSNIAIHSCLLRRSAIGSTRFPESLAFGEDKHFWMSMGLKGCRFFVIPELYCTARIHQTNYSPHSFIKEKQQQLLFYQSLSEDKMLPCKKTRAFISMKLIHARYVLGLSFNIRELAAVLAAPGVVIGELFQFIKRRWQLRWYFILFYLTRKPSSPDLE